jgi:hypothetical protein
VKTPDKINVSVKAGGDKIGALRRGLQAAKDTVAAALVVQVEITRNCSFTSRKRPVSPWVALLDRMGGLKLGEALRLEVPTVPTSLLAAGMGTYVLVREKGMGEPE